MRIGLSLALLIVLSINAYAQTPKVSRIDVVEYGLYTDRKEKTVSAPGVAGSARNIVTDIQHAATTRTVPAQQGVTFGFRFTVVGAPVGTDVPLNMVVIYPSPGLRDPATQKLSAQAKWNRTATIGSTSYTSYKLENDWEIVPGVWTFQVWYQGRKLAEQQFTVVKK